ncbi:MAG: hypothetical protein H7296_09345 [Bacteroidia bacterium]|nr:hypothetical protein [Bacteroidia bacterium]
MKLSNIILAGISLLLVGGLIASNLALNKEYNEMDKNDSYWMFGKISEQPFKHIIMEGGNLTQIIYEPDENCSVRINKRWLDLKKDSIKVKVQNDTLYLQFPANLTYSIKKEDKSLSQLIRIFSPNLLTVNGNNTQILLGRFKQKKISINLKGKSELNLESALTEFDTLHITLSDSSVSTLSVTNKAVGSKILRVQYVKALINDWSQLRLGKCLIRTMLLYAGDSTSVEFSGATINTVKH